ncbi:hypothetical protein JRC04_05000 [Mycolicibacterium sp. S2-37]|uniref:hypothetical protein n=1 Tax=Mycolicibacterium sp. S2-37 TaxID=2810297 RepID=UPI001A94DFE5|nr:hypothetical protein [Mycolicibacterium sp. S2-37]MBO0676815.1 hypothetical protein [Mycolicibacterium sp. S2-37]
MNAEQVAKCTARGISEVLQSVPASTLVAGDQFVKPGFLSVYTTDAEGYASLRADASMNATRFEVVSVGAEVTARRLSDGAVFTQDVGRYSALRVVTVP